MPVASNLTLNSKVYTPAGTQGGITTWRFPGDASFGGGFSSVTESVRGPSKDGIYRTRWGLTVTKLATEDSSCGCAGMKIADGNADIQIRFPMTFSSAEKADLAARIQALVALAVFSTSISGPEGSWG
ncbi:coat protein [ssRNA phage SRR5467091_8]|uniref:Coat protein n=1 Tax=ssRNA phage SRR5467091_8 TaxID=2786473 RepID=A0A8S5L5H5_9VIRU|nr:coat protein [ssRNA phage SRR5467091_8]DAD52514.1 TPA_asm: coat protein [ssRNA phage SRR5467091_8]